MSKSLCLDNLRRKDSWFTLHPYIEEAGTSKCWTFVFIKLLKNHKWQSITLSNCQDIYQDCFSVAYSGWTKNFGKLTSGLYHSANTSHYFFAKLEIIFFAQKTNVDFVSHFFFTPDKGITLVHVQNEWLHWLHTNQEENGQNMWKWCQAFDLTCSREWPEGCQATTYRGGWRGKQNRKQQQFKRGERHNTVLVITTGTW